MYWTIICGSKLKVLSSFKVHEGPEGPGVTKECLRVKLNFPSFPIPAPGGGLRPFCHKNKILKYFSNENDYPVGQECLPTDRVKYHFFSEPIGTFSTLPGALSQYYPFSKILNPNHIRARESFSIWEFNSNYNFPGLLPYLSAFQRQRMSVFLPKTPWFVNQNYFKIL